MIDIKILNDAQLSEMSNAIKKEIGDRFRAKHCDGIFEFEGRGMSRTQAIESFLTAKRENATEIDKMLAGLPSEVIEYLKSMGDLRKHAIRTNNTAGVEKVYKLMSSKLSAYNMDAHADSVIDQLCVHFINGQV